MNPWWRSQEQVSEAELKRGLRNLIKDGVCSQMMGTLAGGAFLVAFALHLNANNFAIGLIAALGPLTQLLQLPTIYLIERLRRRKLIVVVSSIASRLSWLVAAAIPLLVPAQWGVVVFLVTLTVYYGLGTISGLAFR